MAKNAVNYTGLIPETGDSFESATQNTTGSLEGIDTKLGELDNGKLESGGYTGDAQDLKDEIDLKQNITDNGLNTSIKTIVGAINELDSEIDVKAPINSPIFTGNPQAPTPSFSDRDTSIATTEFVKGVAGNKYTFDTIADAQVYSGFVAGDIVEVLGFTTKGDGNGRKYIVKATDDGTNLPYGIGLWFNKFYEISIDKKYFLKENGLVEIIFDGDSITEGNVIGGFKYSEHLKNLEYCKNYINTVNYAVGGSYIPAGSNAGNNISDRYVTLVKPRRPIQNGGTGAKTVALHILIGHNDLSPLYGNMSAQTVITNLTNYCTQAKNDGFFVIVGTILNASYTGWTNETEEKRILVNNAIKTGVIPSNLVVDYASLLSNSEDTIYFIDKVHPTVLGATQIANKLNDKLYTLERDMEKISNTYNSIGLTGKTKVLGKGYIQVGELYQKTYIGHPNESKAGYLLMENLWGSVPPNEKYTEVSVGQDNSSFFMNFIPDAMNDSRPFLRAYRSGITPTSLNFGTHLSPMVDNSYSLGGVINRWSVVYAGSGTINTSDDREKTYLDITEKERIVAKELKLLMKKFKFNSSIDEKGLEKARIHFGTSAQSVKEVFEKYELNAFDYALLCYDEWEEKEEEKNKEGNIIQEKIEAGNRYGVRYEELLCFIISAL